MKKHKWLFVSFSILILVMITVLMFEDTAQIDLKPEEKYLPPVSIVNLESQLNSGFVQTYAEVKPRWNTTLKAQVSGEIITLYDRAFAGQSVKKNETLLHIEDSQYKADLYETEQVLSQATFQLLQEEKQSEQAKKDWKRSGISTEASDLVLNKPQLNVAKKSLSAAKSRVSAARKKLAYTRIKAPFSGVVTERYVSIGQFVVEGDPLLSIVYVDQQEIMITLNKQQWLMLADNWHDMHAVITDTNGSTIAQATIRSGGGFIDPETRQYKLFLEVDDSDNNKVLPGDFVQVKLPSIKIPDSLAIPESALTRSGFIWYLDNDDRLRQFFAKVLFHRDNKIIIKTPTKELISNHLPERWRIATTPLASFLAGNRVIPVNNLLTDTASIKGH